jgi:hypothetical protein
MYTNCHANGDSTAPQRNLDGLVLQMPCPPSVASYIRYMGDVDRGDQLYITVFQGQDQNISSVHFGLFFTIAL